MGSRKAESGMGGDGNVGIARQVGPDGLERGWGGFWGTGRLKG